MSIDLHMLVRKGPYVTFRDPSGLYIVDWNDSGFTKPNGTPVGNYWRIVRGTSGMVLRLEYEVPAGLGFVVGDIKIGGHASNMVVRSPNTSLFPLPEPLESRLKGGILANKEPHSSQETRQDH